MGDKIVRDPEYIKYIENGDSAAVLAVKSCATELPLRDIWIEIKTHDGVKTEIYIEEKGKKKHKRTLWSFSQIEFYMYPRITKRIDYTECETEDEKNRLTWKIATTDIEKCKRQKVKGKHCVLGIRSIWSYENKHYEYEAISYKK